MGTLVTYRQDGSLAFISMDDGKVNALSLAMLSELNSALDRAEEGSSVVVMTGRPGVFSAGFDLNVLTTGHPDAPDMLKAGFSLAERMLSFPTPIVIACTGHALAMGAFLLLSGDFRIGVAGQHRIGANEVAIGLTMPETAIEICRQRLTPSYFSRAVNNAEIFPPDEAMAAGFFDSVVDASDLEGEAQRAATGLASLNMAAHAATKLRSRSPALVAIRAAIDIDDTAVRSLLGGS
jgi:enoyl-CoA hydratase